MKLVLQVVTMNENKR